MIRKLPITLYAVQSFKVQEEEYDLRPWYLYSAAAPLSVTHPRIAEEWHSAKNGIWTPADYTYGSNESVWWRCHANQSHQWRARIEDRTIARSGCPYCSGKLATPDNNLLVSFPKIAAEWHPQKNNKLKPALVLPKSNKSVWWQCKTNKAHEWMAIVANRTQNGTGCPYCTGSLVSAANSFAVLYPQLAREWHPHMNGTLTPADVSYGSNTEVWWQCPKGKDHLWKTTIRNRTKTGKGCPFCHGLKPSITNTLVSRFPKIAAEWNHERNQGLALESIIAGSQKKVWWLCSANSQHEWQARIGDRTVKKSGCPHCVRGNRRSAR